MQSGAKRFPTSEQWSSPLAVAAVQLCGGVVGLYYSGAVYEPLADTSAGCPAINYREATKVDISETCSLLCRRGEWACGVGSRRRRRCGRGKW